MGGGPIDPKPMSGKQAINYFFDLSLFLFVTTGFVAVASTGKLDTPTVVLVAAAIGLRGLAFLGLSRFRLQANTVRGFTIAYFVFYAVDYFAISGSFVSATGHLLFFLLVMKIFSAETNRDYLYLGLIAFMEMLLAAILTIGALFFGLFAIFLLFGIATFTSFEIKRGFDLTSDTGTRAAEISSNSKAFQRSLGISASFVTLGVLVAGGVLFFIMPRFTAGYLSSLAQAQTLSGFSNNVMLGEIGTIKQSTQVVMHIKLNEAPRNPPVMRWRGRGLTKFDGKNWTSSMEAVLLNSPGNGNYFFPAPDDPDRPHEVLRYTITVEPMSNSPVFVAPGVVSASGQLPRLWQDPTDSIYTMESYVGLHYDAVSEVGTPPPAALRRASSNYPPAITHRFLQLPKLDPRVRQLALDVTRNSPTPFDKASAIELHLRTKYGYTLEMAATGPDPVADFLFRVRAGHCEYFASAMTIMLRSIGIPARPVNGFLGGEFNDVSNQFLVRGADAHTWVEAYFPGHGWITFDPTPAAGTEASHGLGRMAMWLDALHLFWTDWVVSFDFGRQFQVFRQVDRSSRQLTNDSRQYVRTRYDALRLRIQDLHERITSDPALIPLGIMLALSIVLAIVFAPRVRYLLRQWRSEVRVRSGRASPRDVTVAYERFLALMARRGMQRAPATTPAEFAVEINDPSVAPLAQEFTVAFEEARYGGATGRLPELYRLLARLERPDTVVK
jgi:protein-glutamine gamma-glutamyltransferase